jgi:secreted effector protein SseD
MNDIRNSTSGSVNACVPGIGANGGADGGTRNASYSDGATQTIDTLIFLVQKLNIEMRDIERQFASDLQRIVFDRQLTTFQMKKEAIEKQYTASIFSSAAEIVSGGLGLFGAASGSKEGVAVMEGLGNSGKGIAGVYSADFARDAKEGEVQAEVQDAFAKQFEQALSLALERANDASHQLRQVTADLVNLQGRVSEAVRF